MACGSPGETVFTLCQVQLQAAQNGVLPQNSVTVVQRQTPPLVRSISFSDHIYGGVILLPPKICKWYIPSNLWEVEQLGYWSDARGEMQEVTAEARLQNRLRKIVSCRH